MSTTNRKLVDEIREYLRLHHYSIQTERNHCEWIRKYVRFHQMRSREDRKGGENKIEAYSTCLAIHENAAKATQLCCAPVATGQRYPHHPGIARTQRYCHHNAVCPHSPTEGTRVTKPARCLWVSPVRGFIGKSKGRFGKTIGFKPHRGFQAASLIGPHQPGCDTPQWDRPGL